MKHDYLVVAGDTDARKPLQREYTIVAVADTERQARERAESCAKDHPGTPYTIYEKAATFTGTVKVSTDEPLAGEDE